jgi:hypothetical protein
VGIVFHDRRVASRIARIFEGDWDSAQPMPPQAVRLDDVMVASERRSLGLAGCRTVRGKTREIGPAASLENARWWCSSSSGSANTGAKTWLRVFGTSLRSTGMKSSSLQSEKAHSTFTPV